MEFLARFASSLVIIPLLAGVIIWAPGWVFSAVVLAVILLCQREWFAMRGRPAAEMAAAAVLSAVLAAGLSIMGEWRDWFYAPFLFITLVVLGITSLGLRREPAARLSLVGDSALAVLFISVPLSFFILLRGEEGGERLVFFLLIVSWLSDTAAYLVGANLGRKKLSPVLSPNKTVEGLAAALVAGAAGGFFLSTRLAGVHPIPGAVLGLLLSGFGQVGDLFESLWKRASGTKDSGHLIPGHGGMLDRVDGFLLAAPALYCLMPFFLGVK